MREKSSINVRGITPSYSFNHTVAAIGPAKPNEFPADQYAANPTLPFSIDFVSPRTLRIRMTSGPQVSSAAAGTHAGRPGAAR